MTFCRRARTSGCGGPFAASARASARLAAESRARANLLAGRRLVNSFTRCSHASLASTHPIAMTKRRKWTAIPGLLALAIGAVVLSAYSGASSSQGRQPDSADQLPAPRMRAPCRTARHELPLLSLHGEQVARLGTARRQHVHGVSQRHRPGARAIRPSARARDRRSSRSTPAAATKRSPIPWDAHPQGAGVRALPAHAPRQRRRHLPDLSRPDPEDGRRSISTRRSTWAGA